MANDSTRPTRPVVRLEVLVGMIGSAKTAYARQRAGQGAVVLSYDDLAALAVSAVDHRSDVVVDRTHLTAASRRLWTAWAAAWDRLGGPGPTRVEAVAVAFPIEEAIAHALRRYRADPRGRSYDDWLADARRHREQARREPLDWRAEGFDRLLVATVQPDGSVTVREPDETRNDRPGVPPCASNESAC